MNNTALEVLYARRPVLRYTSPAICEAVFSSTSFPTLVLSPVPQQSRVTGLVLTYYGEGGDFELTWDNYPGALCYSVYKRSDLVDPFSEYQLVAECITDPKYDPKNWPPDDPNQPGCYLITAITAEGETAFGEPICNGCIILPVGPFDALASEIFSQQLVTAGLPSTPDTIAWAITEGALPAGVTLNPSTGLLSGVVGEVGVFTFTVVVTGTIDDIPFIGEREYQMTVTTTAIECFDVPDELSAPNCADYAATFPLLSGTGVLWEITSGALPDGLTLNGATGEVTGNPEVPGVFAFTMRVTKADTSVCENQFFFTIEDTFPNFSYTDLGNNLTQLSAATINDYVLHDGEPVDGDPLCNRVEVDFTTQGAPPGGFNITFDGAATVEAGQEGTYRFFVNNAKLHVSTLSPPENLLVIAYKNAVEVWRYELAFNIGEQFTDIALAEGDILNFVYTTDGNNPAVDTYNTVVRVEKLS